MNLTETAGCSSCKVQENGDALNESERPLKKARFAWQVKGKHHLKNDAQDSSKPSTATVPEPDKACSSDYTINDTSKRGTEQNLEIIEDYLLKRDTSDQSFNIDKPSVSHEKLPYPTYVDSYKKTVPKNGIRSTSESSNDLKLIPTSMMFPQNYTEEECIARWQNKQVVKGFIDNSINHTLDFWFQHPENESSRFIALEVADFINNLPGDNSVENEGILMAISAHGLQNPTSSNSSSNLDDYNLNNTHTYNDSNIFPLSSLSSDDESHNINNHSDKDNTMDMQWSYNDCKHENDDLTAFQLFPDNSLPYSEVSDSNQNSVECDSVHNPVDNDFLDAAVLFAIQSKGLTTFGSDYG